MIVILAQTPPAGNLVLVFHISAPFSVFLWGEFAYKTVNDSRSSSLIMIIRLMSFSLIYGIWYLNYGT